MSRLGPSSSVSGFYYISITKWTQGGGIEALTGIMIDILSRIRRETVAARNKKEISTI